jgi:spermidine/putrescine transport system substrate-binding protein
MSNQRPLSDLDRMAFARGALTRRDLLRRAGMAGGTLAGASLLAACGSSSGGGSSSVPSSGGAPSFPHTVSSSWTFSNWPLYIDIKNKTDHPSLDAFDKKYGTTTKYLEDIEDYESFFGKV